MKIEDVSSGVVTKYIDDHLFPLLCLAAAAAPSGLVVKQSSCWMFCGRNAADLQLTLYNADC